MSLDESSSGGMLPTANPEVIPPLNQRSTSTSRVIRQSIFETSGLHRAKRATPQPPSGPPPLPAQGSPSSRNNVFETKLPGIMRPSWGDEGGPCSSKPASSAASAEVENSNCEAPGFGLENEGEKEADRLMDNMTTQVAGQPPPSKLLPVEEVPKSDEVERIAHANSEDSIKDLSVAVDNGDLEARLSPVELAVRKAHRVAEARSIAQGVVRIGEKDGNAESGEIERALAAVDETRRKRMARQRTEYGGLEQDEEKLRRRQEKREQLMKKRKDMEIRLEEEANKMAELTESAKKKGETKFMSEEAKRDAEERIRVETEVVARLEQQAADMASRRENMQRDLEKVSEEKAAEIENRAITALQAKRALVEARMVQEEEEIKSASEAAKREVEAKMVAEAASIAEMERRAQEMSAKRAQLEAEISDRVRRENALAQEAELMSRKREKMEAKMRQEEVELETLSEEAKRRVQEKMAVEAAAIAAMERKANELGAERVAMELYMTNRLTPASTGVDNPTRSGRSEAIQDLDVDRERLHRENTDDTYIHPEQDEQDSHGSGAIENGDTGSIDSTAAAVTSTVATCLDDSKGHPRGGLVSNGETSPTLDNHWAQKELAGKHPLISTDVCTHCHAERHGMSPAHVAAATGHVSCLEALKISQKSALLWTLDSAGRSPLFYACANAHAEAVDLLIGAGPESYKATDANQDTPLHAAALAGSALCCRLLLKRSSCDVEPLNATHMTPAHLAANNDVLEVLSQHGANMNAKDADSRTPLFIACAFDRLEKAEYLCELVECAGQDLGEADKRGDSPMHAAAYNGSTACLLLLLQYGVVPDMRNLKGLRPIDLASRRRYSACEKILMEYQLHHHVDNTYFDSVLFMATLEGHKKCTETLTNDLGVELEVQAPGGSPLVRSKSLWSLRRGRSVRLKHWGDWIAYEDQNSQIMFWYNHVTQTPQWKAPIELSRPGANALAHSSMLLKRDGDWIEYTLPDGNAFYYNGKNNEFQWERPDQAGGSLNEHHDVYDDGGGGDGAGGAFVGDWAAFQDPSTGLMFWYNQASGESRWEPPDEFSTTEEPEVEVNSIALGEDVREVSCVDDLFTPR